MTSKSIFLTLISIVICSCSAAAKDGPDDGIVSKRWDFNETKGWEYEHQDDAPASQCVINEDKLVIYTRGNTYDRQKMHTEKTTYRAGIYQWRTYISDIAIGSQASIGSWIYCDDHHELDFEVGPGTTETRAAVGAKDDELVACMTSQDFPFISNYVPITKNCWHDFQLELRIVDGKYLAIWSIDGEVKQEQQLQYGNEIAFRIYCSVENLKFMGNKQPTSTNYGMFDYVTFKGKIKN